MADDVSYTRPGDVSVRDRGARPVVVTTTLLMGYTLIFLPSVFGRIEASEFMSIDPQSIMDAIDGLTTSPVYYDMNAQYHSQFYGWTYFALNAIVIAALKSVGLGSEIAINFAARFLLFLIGAALVASLFLLGRKFLSTFWSAVATLIFVVSPVSAHYFVEIHPETLGLLCQVIALHKLVDVYRSDDFDRRKFLWAVIFLTLSALSKHFFFFVAIFIYLAFFVAYSRRGGGRMVMTWARFFRLTMQAVGVFVVVAFLIHPYAFLNPVRFWEAQSGLAGDHSRLTFAEALPQWVGEIASNPLVWFNLLLVLAVPFLGRLLFPFKLSIALTGMTILIFAFASRTWISSNYFYPLYGFAVFNGFFFLTVVVLPEVNRAFGATTERWAAWSVGICVGLAAAWNLAFATSRTHERFVLDGLNTSQATWAWIASTVPEDSRIAYSPNAALLEPLDALGCHAWRGCGTLASLEAFDPDYLVFSPDYPYFDAEAYGAMAASGEYRLSHRVSVEPIAARQECRPFSFQGSLTARFAPLSCIEAYRQAWAARAGDRIVEGLEIVVYARSAEDQPARTPLE